MIDDFVTMLEAGKGLSALTIKAYKSDLLGIGVEPHTATKSQIVDYIHSFAAPRSQARRLSAFRQYFTYLLDNKLVTENPTDGIRMPRIDAAPLKHLTPAEVDSLLTAAPSVSLKAKAGLEILYSTGLRITEMLSLPATSLTSNEMKVVGKGNLERTVIMSDVARDAAEALRQVTKGPYLFAGRTIGEPMTRQGFALLLKQTATKAGIADCSPHTLRHSFASHMLANGAKLRDLQKLLGHADITTTQLYIHVQTGNMQRAIESHHPLGVAS